MLCAKDLDEAVDYLLVQLRRERLSFCLRKEVPLRKLYAVCVDGHNAVAAVAKEEDAVRHLSTSIALSGSSSAAPSAKTIQA